MRRRAVLAGAATVVVLAAITAAFALLQEGDPPPAPEPPPSKPKPGAPPYAVNAFQPFFYDENAENEFLSRGADGQAHVVYALSPGGVEASVRRSVRWRHCHRRLKVGGYVRPRRLVLGLAAS